MLKWDESEFTQFFGVAAKPHDDEWSHSFEVNRDGLRLLVMLLDVEGTICVSLFRDGLANPLISVQWEFCSHAHITSSRDFRRCFEAGNPKDPVTDMGIPPVLERGVRVFVEPHFQVELIELGYDAI